MDKFLGLALAQSRVSGAPGASFVRAAKKAIMERPSASTGHSKMRCQTGAISGAKPVPFTRISRLRSLTLDAQQPLVPVALGPSRLHSVILYEFAPLRSYKPGVAGSKPAPPTTQ